MNRIRLSAPNLLPQKLRRPLLRVSTALLLGAPAYAQAGGSPWENAVNVLKTAFTGPIATAGLVHCLSTFSGPVLMEYNYQGRMLEHVPVCLDFKNGKLYPNDRPGLGVELDFKHLTQIAEITEPVTARAQTYFRPDGSITNW